MRKVCGGSHTRSRKPGSSNRARTYNTQAASGEPMRRLQLQLVFVLVAAISVATLSAILISSAIHGAERVVIEDTRKTLDAANAENRARTYNTQAASGEPMRRLQLQLVFVLVAAISVEGVS